MEAGDRDDLPEWVTGAEALFLTGQEAEVLRDRVVAGRVALYRPFGRGHRIAFLRTADLIEGEAPGSL